MHTVDNKVHVDELKQYLAKASPNQIAHCWQKRLFTVASHFPQTWNFSPVTFSKRIRCGISSANGTCRWMNKRSPYVTADGYVLSREALATMYYDSMYTKHFRWETVGIRFYLTPAINSIPFSVLTIFSWASLHLNHKSNHCIATNFISTKPNTRTRKAIDM